ncbi:MAG: type 1 glutamine amidotransferase domain-containing protein, partial [Bacteroidota bacterium]
MKLNKKWMYALGGVVVLLIILALALPAILKSFGLHPDYDGQTYNLSGKRALVVTTSHGVLNKPGETGGDATGVFGSEMTIPYYEFLDANMEVDVASIQGGEIPIDPSSFLYFIKCHEDERFLEDEVFQAKVKNSIPLKDVQFEDYDVVFFAGGWGASYDMAQSELLAQKVSEAYY